MGTLELLGQRSIVSREGELDLGDVAIGSQATWISVDDTELEDAVDAAQNARIVIMNPPFTNRANMGEKFPNSDPKPTARTRGLFGADTHPRRQRTSGVR